MSDVVRSDEIAAVILAGGLARRMGGGDKAQKMLAGQSLLDRILDRIRPQVGPLVINANGDPKRFSQTGLPIAPDVIEGHPGPLAGVLTGLEWVAKNYPKCEWMVSIPCDAPFIPLNLVVRLKAEMDKDGHNLACAQSHGRSHPVVGLWSLSLMEDLRQAVVDEELRKVDRWTARHGISHVDFEDVVIGDKKIDPFFNANKPLDLDEVEKLFVEDPSCKF
ncbi:molybdenum cofactor guanylyltransferase MobA [Kiloniella antarctica]|uniref:Molybdenum cofactor guanylyltransferase n=1 Tax=Kiloniella antarctica TaxID=1550907 RepID=A0ABW5BT01_9PROT